MSLYTRFASGLLFPLHERLKGHGSVALRRELERSQWLDATALERLREARLGQFLMRASRSVPYYRELFAAQGLRPAPSMPLAHHPYDSPSAITPTVRPTRLRPIPPP